MLLFYPVILFKLYWKWRFQITIKWAFPGNTVYPVK